VAKFSVSAVSDARDRGGQRHDVVIGCDGVGDVSINEIMRIPSTASGGQSHNWDNWVITAHFL